MATIIDKILAEVCLDERVADGIFDMANSAHMQALFESLTDNFGFNLEDARSVHNKMIEGKYPERQAYNKDGLLVTFPTPEHKQKAISRGTHFEKDPSKGPTNIYGGGQPQAPAGGAPAPAPDAGGGQNVFPTEPATQAPPAPEPQAPAAPQTPPPGQTEPSQLPASEQPPAAAPAAPAAPPPPPLPPSPLPIEPAPLPSGQQPPLPPPNFDPPKAPEVRAAEAQAVKQMMKGDDNNPALLPTMTEEIIKVEDFCIKENLKRVLAVIRHIQGKQF